MAGSFLNPNEVPEKHEKGCQRLIEESITQRFENEIVLAVERTFQISKRRHFCCKSTEVLLSLLEHRGHLEQDGCPVPVCTESVELLLRDCCSFAGN